MGFSELFVGAALAKMLLDGHEAKRRQWELEQEEERKKELERVRQAAIREEQKLRREEQERQHEESYKHYMQMKMQHVKERFELLSRLKLSNRDMKERVKKLREEFWKIDVSSLSNDGIEEYYELKSTFHKILNSRD